MYELVGMMRKDDSNGLKQWPKRLIRKHGRPGCFVVESEPLSQDSEGAQIGVGLTGQRVAVPVWMGVRFVDSVSKFIRKDFQ